VDSTGGVVATGFVVDNGDVRPKDGVILDLGVEGDVQASIEDEFLDNFERAGLRSPSD